MTAIAFGILGPLQVMSDGHDVPLGGSRLERALAALLLEADRTVTIEHLVDVVWDIPPATARRQIQDIVPRLRRRLLEAGAPADVIGTERAGYVLRLGAATLDAHTFDQLVAAGRELIPVDPARAVAALREALALWRGEPLAGIHSPRLESIAHVWLDRQLDVREDCLALELGLGHHEVTAELRTLVDRHPLREPLVGLLIVALHEMGRRAEALDAYRALRTRLAEELGLDPSPDLQQVQNAILRAGPDAEFAADPVALLHRFRFAGRPEDPPSAAEVHRPPPVTGEIAAALPEHESPELRVPAQLPMDVHGFTGRAEELAWLDDMAAGGGDGSTATTILTISGTAGVGKTTLAVHWAHLVRDRFPDGQLYVNLRGFDPDRPAMPPDEAVRDMLDALRVPPDRIRASIEAQISVLRSLLADRHMLILLDNARDSDQVRPLLPGSPRCLVVVTSRDQLPGLVAAEGAHPLPLDLPSVEEAREFLSRRLGRARVAAAPDAADEIVMRCARLPLALAIVAARAATNPRFTLASLAGELRDAQTRSDAFAGSDQATRLWDIFSCSYETLGDRAAHLFRLLSLHPGPDVTVPAAASLAGATVDEVRPHLVELTRAALVAEHAPGRFGFHDLLRAFATELVRDLDSESTRRAALSRIIDHYLYAARRATVLLEPQREPAPTPPKGSGITMEALDDRRQAQAWFTAELPVIVAAVHRAAASGLDAQAWQLATALTTFLHRRARWQDWIDTHLVGLEAARNLGDQAGEAEIHRQLGRAYALVGRLDEGQTHFKQAVSLFDGLGDPAGQGSTLLSIGHILDREHRYQEALALARRSLRLFESAGHVAGQASALNAIGWTYSRLGDHEQALVHCEESIVLHRELGNRHGQATAWDSVGRAYHHLGHPDKAIDCYRRAVVLLADDGHYYHEALCHIRLGDIHAAAGDLASARQSWQQALRIFDELDHPAAGDVRDRLGRPPA